MFELDADTSKVLKRFLMRMFFMMALVAISVSACGYINDKMGLKNDNIIEESVEALIKHNTGIDLDLTPMSPES